MERGSDKHSARMDDALGAEEVLAVAADNEAPDAVLEQLRRLPAGQSFANLQELWSALSGGHVESQRF